MAKLSLEELSIKLKTVEEDSRKTTKEIVNLQKAIASGKFADEAGLSTAIRLLTLYRENLAGIKTDIKSMRAEQQLRTNLFDINPADIDALKKKVVELSSTITESANRVKLLQKEIDNIDSTQNVGNVDTRAKQRKALEDEIKLYLKAREAREKFKSAAGLMTDESAVQMWSKREAEVNALSKHGRGKGIGPDKMTEYTAIKKEMDKLLKLSLIVNGSIETYEKKLSKSEDDTSKSYFVDKLELESKELEKIVAREVELMNQHDALFARPDARVTAKTYEKDGGKERKFLELRALEEKINSTESEKRKLMTTTTPGETAETVTARIKLNQLLSEKQDVWKTEQQALLKGDKPLATRWSAELNAIKEQKAAVIEEAAAFELLEKTARDASIALEEVSKNVVASPDLNIGKAWDKFRQETSTKTTVQGNVVASSDLNIGKTETPALREAQVKKKSFESWLQSNLFGEGQKDASSDKIIADLVAQGKAYDRLGHSVNGILNPQKQLIDGQLTLTGKFMEGLTYVGNLSTTYDKLGNAITRTDANTRKLTETQARGLETQYASATAAAKAVNPNFELKKATFNTAGVGSGVTQLDYGFKDASGLMNKMSVSVDRYGRTLINTSKSIRTFAQGVARDTVEMLKWSMAMSIIYVPMRKLSELMQIMIKNETLLAEVSVTVSNANISVAEIFGTVAKAANAAGESISGVIESFTTAYRATGNMGTASERMSMATKLMNDALILSKISTLDQAEAIDTLAASLRQSGMGLDQGGILLDKWIKTTKVANVDLTTLATGFAILGDSADSAGLSIDELNGLMASIAETGIAGGKEAASQARAIVSGFQSDKAAKELMRYGIAVNDVTTNELRPFMDVMQQIYDLRQAGVLNDADMAKITLALGGGTRRQAVYSAFLENFNRVKEVAAESATAQGDARAAMEKQLDTVQTAITRLGNSFQSLAQTLGESGGLLDLFKNLANFGSAIVDVFDKITASVGKAAPLLYTLGIATMVFNTQVPLKQAAISSSIARAIAWLPNKLSGETYGAGYAKSGYLKNQDGSYGKILAGNAGQVQVGGQEAARPSRGMQASNWLMNSNAGGYALSALATIPALAGTLMGEDDNKWAQAGLGLAGAVTGALLTAGNPIGTIIGQSAGTAMANIASDLIKTNIEEYRYPETTDKYKEPTEIMDANLEKARKGLYGDYFKTDTGKIT